jgi:Domain of unknown function (DUF1707)
MPDNSCMTPQGFNENSRPIGDPADPAGSPVGPRSKNLRASDADRDQAASVINNALAEGRLTAEEHSERLDAIYSAKTHADLVPVLEDLPEAGTARAQAPVAPAPAGRSGRIIAIFGGATRKGGWHAEPVIDIVAVFGGVDLDFREAILPGQEVVLKATAVLGGVSVVVPPEMRVIDDGGIAILGGRDLAGTSAEAAGPDSPVLRVQGTCILGGIDVKRKARKRKRSRGEPGSRLADGQEQGILGPGGVLGAGGVLGPGGILDQVMDQRREVHDRIREQRRDAHDRIREQRRDIHRQMRDQRRQMRRDWTSDDDD